MSWARVGVLLFRLCREMSDGSPVIRVTTRVHCRLTAGSGDPKAMEAMAPAVYSPTPDRGEKFFIGVGEPVAKLVHDLPGGLLQVGPGCSSPGPATASAAGPLPPGPGRLPWAVPPKLVVVVQHRRHPGLLQHDLGHPHVVRGGIAAPGQGALVVPEPLQQWYH